MCKDIDGNESLLIGGRIWEIKAIDDWNGMKKKRGAFVDARQDKNIRLFKREWR